jgi:glutamate 5-kinase
MVSANILVLFSDIDGLYTKNPVRHDDAEHVDEVHEITAEINAMAGASSTQGSGGMITKLEAAEIALSAGCHMVIASGEHQHALKALQEGGKATWFMAKENPHSARKHWIAGSVNQNGAVMVDAGAANALKEGNSLLSAGVKAVEGGFEHGDVVQIKNEQGEVLGVGLIAYPSEEAQKILGRQSDDIEGILGYKRQSVLIHRDDMVLVSGECIGNKKRGQ